ncbi:MAG: hypothetical protein Q8L14_10635 [Myxococcales bacterium]|nr:hypothetical protein [Myxococcales bacterium]
MPRYELLPPRPNPHPLRPLSSAQTWTETYRGLKIWRIQHAVLAGVTPRELLEWFLHLDAPVTIEGRAFTNYLLWHPIDHIHWEVLRLAPDGSRRVGAKWRIVEKFGGHLNVFDVTVLKLDETGIVLDFRLGPFSAGRVEHRWRQLDGGTFYDTSLCLNPTGSPLIALGLRLRYFDGEAWLTHNVEEVGLLEHLIPRLIRVQPVAPARPSE